MSAIENVVSGACEPAETPTYEQARELAEYLESSGDVVSFKRVGANPHLRFTPYQNNRGTTVNMWSCISYYFEKMPQKTLLSAPHIVRPWDHDDWEINMISTPWVVSQLAKTRWAKIDISEVSDSPFGGTICEWSDKTEETNA